MSRTPYTPREVHVLVRSDGSTLPLDDGYSRAVLRVSNRGAAPLDYVTVNNPQGKIVTDYNFDARQMTLELTYEGKNRDAYYSFRDRLFNFIRPNQGRTFTLRHIRANGTMRDIGVYISGPDFDAENTRGSRGFTQQIDLLAPDPMFYNPSLQSVAIDETISGGFGFPFGFPIGFNTGVAGRTIAYRGTAIAYPAIVVTGPFTDLRIYHNTITKTLRILEPLAAGRTLTIDLTPGNITIQDNDENNYFNAVGFSDLTLFALYPDSEDVPDGSNDISWDASGYTDATTVTFQYYERYISL